MTTSLAQQLKKLAVPESSIYRQDKKKTSLLFDPKEAASIDRETFYEIGLSGLEELKSINEIFSKYESTLFSISSKDFERAVQTKDANKRVNKAIKNFLLHLSPYFLLQSSHKALEWLINRFQIHKYNKDDIMRLILPYHETKIFVRCLQIIKVEDATDRWNWLESLQKPGISLAKSVLFNHCASNASMLEFISDMTMKAVKEFGDKAHLLTTLFAFYCSTVVGALEHAKLINESHISNILPGLLTSILSPLEDLRAAAYMITGQLISKAQLKKKIIEHIVDKLLSFHSSLTYEAVLLLQLVYQTQDRFVSISEKSLSNLSPANIKMICLNLNLVVSGGADISRLVRAFMTGALPLIQQNTENFKRFSKLPELIASEISLDTSSAEVMIKCVIDCYSVQTKPKEMEDSDMEIIEDDEEDEEDNTKIQTWYSSFLKTLEQKYPREFDAVLKQELKHNKSLSEKRRLSLNAVLGFAPKLLKKLGDSFLFEKLYHQNSTMRIEAVKYLISEFNNLKKSDENFLKESIIDRLNDEDPDVVMVILSLKTTNISNLITEEVLTRLLKSILQKGLKDTAWWEPSCIALDCLCSFEAVEPDPTTCLAVLPYLFPTSVEGIRAVKTIVKSSLGQVLLSGGDVSKVMTKSNPSLVCQTIFKILEKGSWLPNTDSLMKMMNSALLEGDYESKMFAIILLSFSLQHKTSPQCSLDILNEFMKFVDNINLTYVKESSSLSDTTITLYIATCNTDKLPVQCLTFFLERLVKATDCNDTSNSWIDFTESNFTECFLIRMYDVLIDGCSKKYEKAYSPLLYKLLNINYPTSKLKMEFIANFIYGERTLNTSQQIDPSVVQIRSIRILHLLFLKISEDISWVFSSDPVVFSLLLCLNSEESVVRAVALDIIDVVLEKAESSANYYLVFFKELLSRREEIQLDHEQLPLILYTLLSPEMRNAKKSTQTAIKSTLQALLTGVVNASTPYNIKSKMTSLLSHVNSGDILSTLSAVALDKLDKLNGNTCVSNMYYSQYICNVFSRIDSVTVLKCIDDDRVWKLIINSMLQLTRTLTLADGSTVYLCTLMMQRIDQELFAALPISKAQSIVSALIEAGTFGMDSNIISAASKAMKRIELNPDQFTTDLMALITVCDKNKAMLPKKLKTIAPPLQTLDTKEWKRGVTLIEYLQDKKKLTGLESVLPIFFNILKKCLEFEEQSPVEYAKQLLLTCILNCCQKLCPMENGESNKLSKGLLDIELIVMCIRGTQNPQTHNHALMLLSHAAFMLPDKVLHHMMAIFTFIGSSVLRHDDAYSFQIITRIIETVIPILVKFGDINAIDERELDELEKRVIPVLRIFVDVVLDVPEHRRLPLFKKLILTLSSQHFLWTFLGLIFEGHIMHGTDEKVNINTHHKKVADIEQPVKRVDFAMSLVLEFPPEVIMQSCIKLITYLKTLPVDKQETDKDNDKHVKVDSSAIFSISSHSAKHLRHFKYTIITFINSILSSPILVQKIESITDKSIMEPLYKVFIVNILTYIQVVSKTADQNVGKPQAKYWKVMLHHSYEILDNVNILLSVEMFTMVIRGLMAHNLSTVRRKSMEILNTKLQHQPTYFAECDKEIIYGLLHPLVSTISEINQDDAPEGYTKQEIELNQQTALLSMKLIVRLLAADDPSKFQPILELITNLTKSPLTGNLMASVVLCLAELCSQLKAHAIAYLPKFMPALIKILKSQTKADMPELVLLSVITAVYKIIETIPLFLSPYLEKLLVEFSILSAKWDKTDNFNKNSPIVSKLTLIKNKISTTIAPRVLIPVIKQCYTLLLKKGKFDAIGSAMNILADSFVGVTSAEFTSLQQDLTTFFLLALQFRSDLTDEFEVSPRQVDIIEGHVIKALVALVLKLSESSFRPLYFKIFDWAVRTPNTDNRERAITFYSLSSCMAENLKGLFVLFAGHFVKNSAELLDACNKTKTKNLVFESEEKCCILVENILKTLHAVFLYDSQNFVNKERFETIMQPLVDQLDNDIGGMDQLKIRAKNLISPCISQFAVATADDSLWKPLNYQILLKTRHNDADIRLLGVECMSEMATKLGDSWLPLLPESVPFLAELLEDEVPSVEAATQKSVQTLEAVLGEPLQKYF